MFEKSGVAESDGVATSRAAAVLRDAAPGPASIRDLAAVDASKLPLTDQLDLLVAWERQAAWVAAEGLKLLAEIAGSRPATAAELGLPAAAARYADADWIREEVAAALRLSAGTAQSRMDVARQLTGRLRDTLRALEEGRIHTMQARAVADATEHLSSDAAREVQTRVLKRAEQQTLAQMKQTLRRAVISADPATAAERHKRAVAGRYVRFYEADDGMADIYAHLPAEAMASIREAVQAHADRIASPQDGRTAESRRADALTEICVGALASTAPVVRQHSRAHMQIVVAAGTLLGLDDAPAELAGYGPICAEQARELAADATWSRLLTDKDTGRLLDYGRKTYRPPADLARFVVARDRTCRFPACRQPASRADLDHNLAYDKGGNTDRANLAALCRRHHIAKTFLGWSVHRDPNTDVCTWTSPSGKRYIVYPPEFPPDG